MKEEYFNKTVGVVMASLLPQNEKRELIDSLRAMEKETKNNGWIPCKERLPSKEECLENDDRFIVTDGNRIYQDDFDIYADGYNEPKWVYSNDMVIAWQSLPEPYREEKEDGR